MKKQDKKKSKMQTPEELNIDALLNEEDLEKLEEAIYALEPYINAREVIDALKSLLKGKALRTELVAKELLLSLKTFENHIYNIKQKT